MSVFHLPVLAAVAALVVGAARGQESGRAAARGIDLSVKALDPSATSGAPPIRYVLKVRSVRTSKIPKISEQVQSSEWTQDLEMRAPESRPGGLRAVKVEFGRMRIKTYHPMFGPGVFDSNAPPPPSSTTPMLVLASANHLGFLRATPTFVLDASGTITDVEGSEVLRATVAGLADQSEAWGQYRQQFQAFADACFSTAALRKFLQPLFPQTDGRRLNAGDRWRPATDHYLFGGLVHAPKLEWAGEQELDSVNEQEATIKIAGSNVQRHQYQFGFGAKDPSRGGRVTPHGEPVPSSESRPFRGRVVSFVADGEGVILRADGLWKSLRLKLEWLDDKPAFKEDPAPDMGDERRTDLTTYELNRVQAFDK
jgi:hypothetical protein